MDGCHCIIAKVAAGRNSIRERVRRHLSILKCGTKGEKFMKIATLLLFSVMMMVPSPSLFSAPFQKDKPAEVDRAEQSLQTAKGELEKAGTEWGGHRVQAIKHIDAALKELEQAEQWARQHHDIKRGLRRRRYILCTSNARLRPP